ncbi:MAG: hypothetical protein JRI91_15730 [Deltaproteobacteria bacterium]|nr:hypothetical protein [Deltaproteobacteria bacterium]
MTYRYLKTFFILLICMAAIGCASANKSYVTEITDGESIPGETAGYIYNFSKKASSETYLLSKRKYCFEEVEKLAHERKRSQDVSGVATTVLLPIGIAFPVLGPPVLSKGFEKSRGETVEMTWTVDTGRIMPCGEYEPAADEMLVLMTSEMKIIKNIHSDKNGLINLNKVIASAGSALYINVFIEHEDSVYFVATKYIK